MATPHNDEKLVNGPLAQALNRRHPRWQVDAEQTQTLTSSASKQPDVLIKPAGRGLLPLLIETEHDPAHTVEDDADKRFGETLASTNTTIERVVALKLPAVLRTAAQDTFDSIIDDPSTQFEWCVRSREGESVVRWPETGWLVGNVDELTRFCELQLIDDQGLAEAAKQMDDVVDALANTLWRSPQDRTVLAGAATVLQQADNEQTARMALTLMANAFVFERAIQGTRDEQGNLLPVSQADDSYQRVLANWQAILNHNYYPIFKIARRVLSEGIRDATATVTVIPQLVELASDLGQFGVTSTGDIAGQMFGRLITDRKYLATFYTLPPSAYLMAELVAGKLDASGQTPTACGDQLDEFRVADLACGTGALLTALYQRIAARIRSAGNDDAGAHRVFMEKVIYASDIMPGAAHLTATLLSSTHPSVTYTDANVALYPVGQMPETKETEPPSPDNVSLGSLELLGSNEVQGELLGQRARREKSVVTRTGEEAQTISIGERTLDVCVMNPPFTSNSSRPTKAEKGLKNRKWAGLGRTEEEQEAMEAREERLVESHRQKLKASLASAVEPAYHGNIGLATPFMDVADTKLKHGGVLGLILPQTLLSGKRWENARKFIEVLYEDVVVVTIATAGQEDRAFSAGTGMAECMLVARKRRGGASGRRRVLYVSLHERPASTAAGVEIARAVTAVPDGTASGELRIGSQDVCGTYASADRLSGHLAGVRDVRLTEISERLAAGTLDLPTVLPTPVPVTTLGEVGSVSPNHVMIGTLEETTSTSEEGPLIIHDKRSESAAWQSFTYRTLWWNDHTVQRNLEVLPDAEGTPREGRKTGADALWADWATRLHMNLEFTLNSQPLAACRTPAPTIGGGTWPSIKLADDAWESMVVLWHNTTFGLLQRWASSGRQQLGKARLTVGRLPDLPTLDYRQLTDEQLAKADEIYERFTTGDTKLTLRPANEAWHDQARHELDRAVLEEVLGLDWASIESPLATLREQWCSEPSVHGGQLSRPYGVGGNINLVLARERLRDYSRHVTSRRRQTAWRKLSGRRTKIPAEMKHYLVVLDELGSLSGSRASELAADVAEIVAFDINLARAGSEEARASLDDADDDDQDVVEEERRRMERWEHLVLELENIQGRLDDLDK